jgi:uncharacterized protein (TIGR02118 family)
MIKQFTLVDKKPGLSDEEFNYHWKYIHGPIFAKSPGLKRYVQNHFVKIPGVQYKGDGIVETWFDDMKSQQKLKEWIQSGQAKELMDDAAKFLATTKDTVWFADEHVIVSGGSYKIKQIGLVYKKPGMSRNDFNKYWKDIHGPFASKKIAGLKKYIQNHFIEIPGVKYEGDGIAEVWFDDLEAFKRFDSDTQSNEAKELAEDAARFIDITRKIGWIVEEHVIK